MNMTPLDTVIVSIHLSLLSAREYTLDRLVDATRYGIVIGKICLAHQAGLINRDEYERLNDLALNAATYAKRDARQQEACHA